MSDSLWPHGLQHARPACPSPTPGVYSNSCHWVGDAIQPSHPLFPFPFSSCPQSFPASGSFQMIQLFASGGQSIVVFSFNISPSNEHSGLISFRMDCWISLHPRESQKSSPTPQFKSINYLEASLHRYNWLNHQTLAIESISNFSPLPVSGKWD